MGLPRTVLKADGVTLHPFFVAQALRVRAWAPNGRSPRWAVWIIARAPVLWEPVAWLVRWLRTRP